MTRRPVDQLSEEPKPQGQDGIWVEVRRLNVFSVTDIVKATDINRKTVSDYIRRLEAGKYVEKHTSFEETNRYALLRDGGIHAPRLKKDGAPVTMGGGTMNMWRSMRMLGQFTPRDLAMHSTTSSVSVNDDTAKSYCSMLLKAKYLRVLRKAVPGKHQATYKFIRNTGPLPPQIQRVKQVFDPNIRQVTYYPEARP